MTAPRFLAALCVGLAVASCTSTNPLEPKGTACALGPIPRPEEPVRAEGEGGTAPSPDVCSLGTTGCPVPKPFGARTLVGVATCDYATGGAPCTPVTTVCPLTDPTGNQPIRFLVGERGCTSVVDILLQSTGDGGAGVEWRVQEREMDGQRCVSKGSPRIGLANVLGSCCSTEVDLPVPEHGRTFRFVARTDWRR